MTEEELKGCFKLLRSYWPGEWDEARYVVWADAFDDYSAQDVADAIRAMSRLERFPTVAAFIDAVADVRRPRGPYLPEWIPAPKALPTESEREAVIVHMEAARAAIRGKRVS
jgi:hypothetical protein